MKEKYIIIILFFVYLIFRLYFLFTFPPFTDESLYARWGQLMIHNPDFRWASLFYVHRQPLAMWLFGAGALIFQHFLYGARLMMLVANIPVFFILWSISERIFSRRVALVALGLFAVNPLFILMQTMAMMDGFLFAISCVLLWLFVIPWKGKLPIASIAVGILLGIALWIKSTAMLLVVLSLVALAWKKYKDNLTLVQIVSSCVAWIVIPVILLIPLIVHKDFIYILKEPDTFLFTFGELMHIPFMSWVNNLVSASVSILFYNPVILISFAGIWFVIRKKQSLILVFWFLTPLLITTFIGKHIMVRYFIAGTCAMLPFLAYGMTRFIDRMKWKPIEIVLWCVLGAYGIFFISFPAQVFHFFPAISGEQGYAIGYPSGNGIPELVNWIDTNVHPPKVLILAVPDSPGNPSDYLLGHYYFSQRVKTIFVTLSNEEEFRKIEPIVKQTPVYLAVRGSLLTPDIEKYLTPVVVFQKPYKQDFIGLYQISFTTIP
jgi:4-amino-4-deoxy-L-arabinose transferase-like glycosyltransferase